MKAYCNHCGVHFINEFETTLKPICNYWGDLGLANLDVDLKKKLWDWIFLLPSDEVFIRTGVGISIAIKGVPVEKKDEFEHMVTNWSSMSEEEKQEFQRNYFKGKIPNNGMPITYGTPKKD